MPTLVNVNCNDCSTPFTVTLKRYNESVKNKWNFFCSRKCLSRNRSTGEYLICSNPKCRKEFYRKRGDINVKNNFCSQSCSATVTNSNRKVKLRSNKIRKLYKSGAISKKVIVIEREVLKKRCFYEGCNTVISLRNKYCSNECQWLDQAPTKEEYAKRALKAIRKFYKENGRIPVKRELQSAYKWARKGFGTWNKAIVAAGLKPNPVMFANRHKAKDGHICDSFAEMLIDNWLFERGIPHEVNVPYPHQKRKGSKLTADFLIGNIWVEFFGLSGEHVKYDRLVAAKMRLIVFHNLNFIAIRPEDLFPESDLDNIFADLLVKSKAA